MAHYFQGGYQSTAQNDQTEGVPELPDQSNAFAAWRCMALHDLHRTGMRLRTGLILMSYSKAQPLPSKQCGESSHKFIFGCKRSYVYLCLERNSRCFSFKKSFPKITGLLLLSRNFHGLLRIDFN